MKNILLILFTLFFALGTYAQTKKSVNSSKKLVAYFSCTGNTKQAAQKIADAIGAELYEIKPAKAYVAADLDYRNKKSRSTFEMQDPSSRPAVSGKIGNIKKYDIIYVGYPIWWNLAPRIINSFIEKNNFKGKKVALFATSGSSTIDNSEKELKKNYKDINWQPGLLIKKNTDNNAIIQWTNGIK